MQKHQMKYILYIRLPVITEQQLWQICKYYDIRSFHHQISCRTSTNWIAQSAHTNLMDCHTPCPEIPRPCTKFAAYKWHRCIQWSFLFWLLPANFLRSNPLFHHPKTLANGSPFLEWDWASMPPFYWVHSFWIIWMLPASAAFMLLHKQVALLLTSENLFQLQLKTITNQFNTSNQLACQYRTHAFDRFLTPYHWIPWSMF